MHQPIGNRVA
ncbi:hypothetical protein VCCP1050_0239, partial [Vibrio cholerae CP1050(23)]